MPYIQAEMVFAVIMTLIIGGFIVTFPIMRRLGRVMEETLRERQQARLRGEQTALLEAQISELRGTLDRIEGHVGLLAERQDFVDSLLTHREQQKLRGAEDW
ncbi:MAG: hypothetical protein R3195_18260 [Gemmatimonadota bacterium]|nr:hypothetical protein [Gemmatimonadota bacterium]